MPALPSLTKHVDDNANNRYTRYATLLLGMVSSREFTEPFHRLPGEGLLPKLPPYLAPEGEVRDLALVSRHAAAAVIAVRKGGDAALKVREVFSPRAVEN